MTKTELTKMCSEVFADMRNNYPSMTMGDLQSVAKFIVDLLAKSNETSIVDHKPLTRKNSLECLNGESCPYCRSHHTTWLKIAGCEVEYECDECRDVFVLEISFLSDHRQQAIAYAKE